jgi:hypothetical protein
MNRFDETLAHLLARRETLSRKNVTRAQSMESHSRPKPPRT